MSYEYGAENLEEPPKTLQEYAKELYLALPQFAFDSDNDNYLIKGTEGPSFNSISRVTYVEDAYAIYLQAEDGNVFRTTEVMSSYFGHTNIGVVLVHDAMSDGIELERDYGESLVGTGYIITVPGNDYDNMMITSLTKAGDMRADALVSDTTYVRYVIEALQHGTKLHPDHEIVKQLEAHPMRPLLRTVEEVNMNIKPSNQSSPVAQGYAAAIERLSELHALAAPEAHDINGD